MTRINVQRRFVLITTIPVILFGWYNHRRGGTRRSCCGIKIVVGRIRMGHFIDLSFLYFFLCNEIGIFVCEKTEKVGTRSHHLILSKSKTDHTHYERKRLISGRNGITGTTVLRLSSQLRRACDMLTDDTISTATRDKQTLTYQV